GTGFDPSFGDNCAATIYHDYALAPNSHTLAGATFELGTTTVTWTVVDENGNTATCAIDIEISDNEDPTALCLSGLTIQLGSNGSYELPLSVVDVGSYDNCQPLVRRE
ncbi:MAG: HYR domain-containing protein, partial [Saprospiraceae bacterium]|nr:HYR domain-containing protein [Saprospiraceae bacterium]MCB0625810.1 HYR domain-containing protein [Saprospiraceae bacterium]